MGHAISVDGGCFNNIIASAKIANRISTSLGTIIATAHSHVMRGVTGLHITSTVSRMFTLFHHYGGCVSRAAP